MEELLTQLYQRTFSAAPSSVVSLKGDGSDRRLFRLTGGGRSVIGAINSDRRENEAFLKFSRHFRNCGVRVPEIYSEDIENGIYIEEDLGDTNLFQLMTKLRRPDSFPAEVVTMYRRTVEDLPRLQIEAGRTLDYSFCYPRHSFDRQSMMWDLNYFKYYFLRLSKIPFSEQDLEDDFVKFCDFLLSAERDFFLYRDFQSRNIMVRDGKPWFIDYQGGRRGALQYDIASLLYDAKADLPFEMRDELLAHYMESAAKYTKIDKDEFVKYFHGYVFIRIMQAMGCYGLRGFYERKQHFLKSIPYAIQNIEHLLGVAKLPVELPALMAAFKRLVGSSYLRQFGDADLKLTVRVQSFSFRKGLPVDEKGHGGGFIFDCRALPNPGRYVQYSKLNGKDVQVIEFLQKEPSVALYLNNVFGLIDQAVENYQSRNFTDLMVSFGCTGGQHRSVYCAEQLARHLQEKYKVQVEISHREQGAI